MHEYLKNYICKTVTFKFRGMDFVFDLSQGLFSSADVDWGTRMLLKIFSQVLDEDAAAGKAPPLRILDSGCGTGVIGICAAAAVLQLAKGGVLVRCQDRDELARLVTTHNAAQNGIPPSVLEAQTGPLLAGTACDSQTGRWDMILSNIPAKAGMPVLEDFIRRSAGLLSSAGRCIIVAVRPLADFIRKQIEADAELLLEHQGPGHSVFVYGKAEDRDVAVPVDDGPGFCALHPFYFRAAVMCRMENIPIYLETVYGASGFDNPGGAVSAAVKLILRMGPQQFAKGGDPVLIHEPGQGFFPCWLVEFLRGAGQMREPPVLSGRNILALRASQHNTSQAAAAVPSADLQLGRTALLEAAGGRLYGCIAAFPELLPQSSLPKGANQLAALWDSVPPLLAGGGLFLASFGSTDAERFDRKKPPDFTRLGSIKRDGFRALAYQFNSTGK